MNIKSLETLLAVHRHGSMAEAARRLNVTHGAVAQQIRALESWLRTPLVQRVGKTVHLTRAAHRILETSQKILDDLSLLPALANADEIRGELRLGAGNTMQHGWMPDILARLAQHYPALQVHVHTGLSADFYASVENGTLDAAIALEPGYALPKTIGWRQLTEEPFFLLAAARHAGQDAHTLLQREPFIRYDRHSWVGRQVDAYLKRVGIVPQERFELSSTESIALLVHKGLGVSIVPHAWQLWERNIEVVSLPLPAPCEPRRFGLLWSRASPRLQLVEVLLEAALQVQREATAGGGLVLAARAFDGNSPLSAP